MTEFINDTQVRRLAIRRRPGYRDFYYFMWTENGASKRLSLGRSGDMTIGQARSLAREHAANLARGISPATRQTDVKGKPTMADLFNDWVSEIGRHKKTAAEDRRIWNRYCCDLHNLFVHEVRRVDFKSTFDAVSAPMQANRVLAFLTTITTYAFNSDEYDLSHNPCAGIRRHKEAKRERYLSQAEWDRFSERLMHYRDSRPDATCFLLLLAYTGARKSEISNMRWRHIRGGVIELDEHKTDQTGDTRRIYLPEAAQEILRTLPRKSMDDYVLRVRNPRALFETICQDTQITNLRIHDLRHNFASVGANAGMTLQEVGALLGHRSTQTTQRYAHLFDDKLRSGAQLISDRLAVVGVAATK